MNVKYLNPFFAAIKDVSTQVLGTTPNFAKPSLKKTPFSSEEVLIIIGITGELNGKAIINLNKVDCVQIASKMMGGMEMQFDEISKSAIGELFNMILGTAARYFEKDGIRINITSPTILEGQNVIVSQKETIISVPLFIEETKITVNISAESKVA
ncbi:MAG: chemotaxis protein CheX [Clostridia bacterium]|nr:chemotaxis protein CheX [Clostridia bacterium]